MRSFSEIDTATFIDQLKKDIKSKIEKQSKEYILGIDREDYIDYLTNEFILSPIVIDIEKENLSKPINSKEWVEDRMYGGRAYERDVYKMVITYPFTGSASLFGVRPPRWIVTYYEINVKSHASTVSFSIELSKLDKDEFEKQKKDAYNRAFSNIEYINAFVTSCNQELISYINAVFNNQKAKFQKENDFFTAVNIPINQTTQSVFTPPLIKKKEIPQPIVNKNKEFSSEPIMNSKMYEDILGIIYNVGKGMERKPSLYVGKDEEALRDIFLLMLETRYDAITATGETFNRGGKTDILLKYAADGSNLFVAECKFWHGYKGFLDTISQLFDRYLTWRDSKVAVMIFVKNSDFTSVLKNISTEVRNHPYYLKQNGHRGESSFSYTFHLQQDQNKHVQLEVMSFHFDK